MLIGMTIQLEALNNQLILEYRIQEGAENLLNMELAVSDRCIMLSDRR
jgi:hypothetical protein